MTGIICSVPDVYRQYLNHFLKFNGYTAKRLMKEFQTKKWKKTTSTPEDRELFVTLQKDIG